MPAHAPGAETLLAAALIRNAAKLLREAAANLPEHLRVDASMLRDAAGTLAEQAEAVGQDEAEFNRRILDTDLKDRAKRQRGAEADSPHHPDPATGEGTEQRESTARAPARPRTFTAGPIVVSAAAVEAVLAGQPAVLSSPDRLYLFARIEALGGLRAVDLEPIAAALDSNTSALERGYRLFRHSRGLVEDAAD